MAKVSSAQEVDLAIARRIQDRHSVWKNRIGISLRNSILIVVREAILGAASGAFIEDTIVGVLFRRVVTRNITTGFCNNKQSIR